MRYKKSKLKIQESKPASKNLCNGIWLQDLANKKVTYRGHLSFLRLRMRISLVGHRHHLQVFFLVCDKADFCGLFFLS